MKEIHDNDTFSTLTTRFLYNEQESSFDRTNRIYKVYSRTIL
jgi:hypothetical protein